MAIEEKKTYTESAMVDCFKNHFKSFKDIKENYKYLNSIDESAFSASVIEIDFNDFLDEIKDIIETIH